LGNIAYITSDGFTMTLFPAAKAGAIFLTAINNGWLNGWSMVSTWRWDDLGIILQ